MGLGVGGLELHSPRAGGRHNVMAGSLCANRHYLHCVLLEGRQMLIVSALEETLGGCWGAPFFKPRPHTLDKNINTSPVLQGVCAQENNIVS